MESGNGGVPEYIVFTDASWKRCQDGRSYTGYAAVVLNTRTNLYTTMCGPVGSAEKISYGEAYAVYRGLAAVRDITKKRTDRTHLVLTVTDSELTVNSLTKYITKSWDCTKDVWTKKDGAPVQNQGVYRRILGIVHENPHLDIRIVHINSHLKKSDKGLSQIKKSLMKCQINVTPESAETFIEMNSLADRLAGEVTSSMIRADRVEGPFYRLVHKKGRSMM